MNDDSHLIDPEDREERVKARALDESKGPGFIGLWESDDGRVQAKVCYDYEDFSVETEDEDGSKWSLVHEELVPHPQSDLVVFQQRQAAAEALPRGDKNLVAPDELQRAYLDSLRLDAVEASAWAQEQDDDESIAHEQKAADSYLSARQTRRAGGLAWINSSALVQLREQHAHDARAARKAGAREAALIKRRVVKQCDALLAKHRIVN